MMSSARTSAVRDFILKGSDMNLYTMVGSGIGSAEAAALSLRLSAWHDAMVAHERKIRVGRIEAACDDECPHAEAPALWNEAVEAFGVRAQDLTFLRTRAMGGPGGQHSVHRATQPARSSEPPRTTTLEF